ncbi:DUF6049 family protein [Actinomarinicola tropica]|uniref:Secreted protein n=1 Tax=Actinomarinicola tropica TaxID=2789776 RepID=A0A5Q2RRV8_9ACTN|nr:DUF6049 family protein [Actinomarinicola tropica]QGG96887.1 hypothetical protein GH723_18265 [Actinomarinicola tropica]
MRRTAALAVLAALLLLVVPPTAGAQPDAGAGDGASGVALVSQTTWIAPDGEIRLRIDTSRAEPTDRLTVTLHGRLLARYQLVDSLAGEDPARSIRTIVDGPIAELDADGDGLVDARLGLRATAGDPERQLIAQEGLHPVHVTLTSAEGDQVGGFVTHVARVPDEVEQTLGLAVVQPLPTTPSHRADGTIAVDDATRQRLTRAAAVFADADLPVTFGTQGEALQALAVSGNPLDAELLEALADPVTDGALAATPFVDIDPDALVRAELAELVPSQIAHGAQTATLALGQQPDDTTWIAEPDLGATGLGALVDAGVRQVVVPHEALVGELPVILVQPFALRSDAGLVTALSTEPGLQSHLQGDDVDVLDVQHLLADLAAVWFERPAYARGTVVQLPPDVLSRPATDALVRGLSESPLLSLGTVDEVIADADPAAADGIDAQVEVPADRLVLDLPPWEGDRLPGSYRADLRRTEEAVDSFRAIFQDADVLAGAYDQRIAVSASSALSDDDRLDHLRSIRDDIAARNANIGMPDRGAITLPSRDGEIPLTLVNNTGAPATVVVTFASDKLEFPQGDRLELTLTEPQTALEVPVRARASGAFPLDMTLESPDGRTLFVDSRYTVRSTAVSGLGIVLSVTAVVVLGAWWVRTARRARAAHHAAQ